MSIYKGLTNAQVNHRLIKYGYNQIESQKSKNIFKLLYKILQEPMIFLLVFTGVVYVLLGEPKDSIALFSTIVIVIGVTIFQEKRTENALQALKDLSSPRALVIRNNKQIRIAGKEVVVDDILILNEGDRVSADGLILESLNFLVDESILTGESIPVNKFGIKNLNDDIKNYPQNNLVFSGTVVIQGSSVVKVTKTGVNSKIGLIGESLLKIEDEDFLLKKEIKKIINVFFIFGMLACILLFLLNYYLYKDILNSILSGLTLAIAMLPEEFPLVLIIFLTLGAFRLSKKKVLARNNQSIETLGATTVLCVDKTGTLTYNRMELSLVKTDIDLYEFNNKKNNSLSNNIEQTIYFSKLASNKITNDPLEQELNLKFEQYLSTYNKQFLNLELVKEYPLTKDLFSITRVYIDKITNQIIVATKGSPEAVLKMCRYTGIKKESVMSQVYNYASSGKRVLAVAKAKKVNFNLNNLPKDCMDFEFEYMGLLGFTDNIRRNVDIAVKNCYNAGIRVIMLTGDYPVTAMFIAKQAGILNSDKFLTGQDLESLSIDELSNKIKNTNIFARIVPHQKLKIIEALKLNGEIVAMTGDGVNDAPALKSAHIGISMGQRGTDVARESSDLVILDDDFSSIVSAISLGRRIYDNLQKAVSYIFSLHIPIAGASLLPVLFGLPPILYPIHIAFFEFIIDPAYSSVFESYPGEKNIMKRPPRNSNRPLFYGKNVTIALVQGLILLFFVFSIYVFSLNKGYTEIIARSIAFTTLVLGNLILILTNLSKKLTFNIFSLGIGKPFYILSLTVFLVIFLYLNNPFFSNIFRIGKISFLEIFYILVVLFFTFISLEISKILRTGNKN